MILDTAKRYIIVIRAPELGHPFSDGGWHVVSECPTYHAMRSRMTDIACSVVGVGVDALLIKGEDAIGGKVVLRSLMARVSDKNLPALDEIARDDDADLRGFNLLVEASNQRYNTALWRKYLESGAFEGLPSEVVSLLKRMIPRSVIEPPKLSPLEWLRTTRGYSVCAAILLAVVATGMVARASSTPEAARPLTAAEERSIKEWRAGAYDILQRNPETGWVRRVRVYPDGTRKIVPDTGSYYYLGQKLPVVEMRAGETILGLD
ncbi:hypothetical protein [Bosea sp. RAC05]|uniref:hypothetical protein n=1 Tax=Bosea sp. RAC05 TaxID=1842539 RepID=UPI000856BA9B|nr:hypothetical protein [Bosea sp. RAC05]AOG02858.1 hypothetical protein BSY19_5402 [Bosea sp. RAC05]